MINLLKVCDKCEAEFVIGHNMNQRHYIVRHCAFCGEELEVEMEELQRLRTLLQQKK